MNCTLFIHFGSPKNQHEVGQFVSRIFKDQLPTILPLYSRLFLKFPLELIATKKSIKKYESIKFDPSYINNIEKLRKAVEEKTKTKTFVAALYGTPLIEKTFAEIYNLSDEMKEPFAINRIKLISLFPHAPENLYNTMVERIQNLQIKYQNDIKVNWAPLFFDNPLFISLWVDCIKAAINQLPLEQRETTHIIFSAHAYPKDNESSEYEDQITSTVKKIIKELGDSIQYSIAYQSAAKFGKWTTPTIEDEIYRLSSQKVSCVIAPISFLFENIETKLDIDNKFMTYEKTTVVRTSFPGDSPKLIEMLSNMVKQNI